MTVVTTEKQNSKTNTKKKKNIQTCGEQAASNSIWLCPSNKTKFYFFFFSFSTCFKIMPVSCSLYN